MLPLKPELEKQGVRLVAIAGEKLVRGGQDTILETHALTLLA